MTTRNSPSADVTATKRSRRMRGTCALLLLTAGCPFFAVAAGVTGQRSDATHSTSKNARSQAHGQNAAEATGTSAKQSKPIPLQEITVSTYVPRRVNAAAKMTVPIVETPQAVSVIHRAQMKALDWQSLDQVVSYTSGVIGGNYGSDPEYSWITMRGFRPTVYIDGLRAPTGSVDTTGIDLFGFQSVEVLKGPSSALYGSASPGGIIQLVSRRPESAFNGSASLQYGNYANKQASLDLTGPLNKSGNLLGRFTSLYFNRHTQRKGTLSHRLYAAPALTWLVSNHTALTFLAFLQHDDIYGDGRGFLPIYGTLRPNPLGQIPTYTNLGEPGYNHFERTQYGVGYEFEHKFNDTWRVQQNLMYFSNKQNILQIYGTGLATNAAGVPIDYRTVTRANFPFKEHIRALEVDTRLYAKFDSDVATQNILFGLSFRHYDDDAQFGFASAPSIDLYKPVYGVPVTTPPFNPYLQQVQKQIGLYGEDVIKMRSWVFTAGLREDHVKTANFGTASEQNAFTYHAGVNYLMGGGFAPYVSYATSFQPTTGATFEGKSFAPTKGTQMAVGLKYQPTPPVPGVNTLVTLSAYDLKQNNVLTPDPHHAFFKLQTGQVEVKGVELQASAHLYNRWNLNFAYTVMNPRVTESNGANLGKLLPSTPTHMLSALVGYTFRSGPFAGFGGNVGVRYIGSSYGDPANQFRTPAVTLLDATLHYQFAKHWSADLSASNLADKTYVARCTSVVECYYGPRRVINLSVTRRFY